MRRADESAEVLIAGGGVVGLALARALARHGVGVTLVERGALGAEASWAAGGMLAPQAEADAADPFFALACAARDAYPAFAAELLAETGIDIELDQTGTLYVALTAADEAEIARRYEWQRAAGLAVEWLTGAEARALEPELSAGVRAALKFPRDGQVENRRLVAALRHAVEAAGVRVLERTEVTAVRVEHGRATGVETARGPFGADAVVVACGAWSARVPIADAHASAQTAAAEMRAEADETGPRVEPVRGQMLCFACASPFVRHVVYSPRGYLVPRRDGRLLAGSTTERVGFRKAVTAAGLHAITAHALELAPSVGALPLLDAWSGLRPCGANEWPVVGAAAEIANLYFATAHYRNGILLAPFTAALLAEQIVTQNTPRALAPFTPEALRRPVCAG